MLLFRPEHVLPIYTGKKTMTSRLWKTRRAVPGSIHQARLTLFGKPFAELEILEVDHRRLGNISDADALNLGYRDREEYFKVLREINKRLILTNEMVWVVRWKWPVSILPGNLPEDLFTMDLETTLVPGRLPKVSLSIQMKKEVNHG